MPLPISTLSFPTPNSCLNSGFHSLFLSSFLSSFSSSPLSCYPLYRDFILFSEILLIPPLSSCPCSLCLPILFSAYSLPHNTAPMLAQVLLQSPTAVLPSQILEQPTQRLANGCLFEFWIVEFLHFPLKSVHLEGKGLNFLLSSC